MSGRALDRYRDLAFPPIIVLAFAGLLALCADPASANHVGCGDTITADTTLDSNLLDCPNNGLVAGANGVTIDLNGHVIDGDEALNKSCGKEEVCDTGIVNEGFDAVAVVGGGTVREFGTGALSINTNAGRFRGIALRRNTFLGTIVAGGQGATLRDLTIKANGLETDQAGVGVFDSRGTRIAGSKISANGDIGLLAEGSSRTHVARNRIANHPEAGILLSGHRAQIVRNSVDRNGDGIAIGGNGNLIGENRVTRAVGCGDGCGIGIQIEAGRRNVVAGNRIAGAERLGLSIAGYGPIAGVAVQRNKVADAGRDGIVVRPVFEPVAGVELRANRASKSGDDGIDVAVKSARLTDNVARRNGDHGIEARAGVADGGGNRASGNRDARQCVNVSCQR